MPGPNRFSPPCTCCECPQTLCVRVVCGECETVTIGGCSAVYPIDGVAVEARDSGDVLEASCTTGLISPKVAAKFDGADYLSLVDDASVRSGERFWTSVWIKPDTTSGTKTILRKTNDTGEDWAIFAVGTSVVFQVTSYGTTYEVTKTVALAAGVWAHIFAYVDATAERIGIYINGAGLVTASAPKVILEATSSWSFAGDMEGWSWTTTAGTATASWESGDGSPASGCAEIETTALTADGNWRLGRTWADLGVPSGKTPLTMRMSALKTKAHLIPAREGGPEGPP